MSSLRRFFQFFLFVTLFLSFGSASAQLALLKEGKFNYLELFEDLDPIQARLLAENESIESNEPFWLAVQMDIAESWHTYWKNPGDIGKSTEFTWTLPSGFTISKAQYPHPKRFSRDGFITFGFEKSLTVLFQVSPPENLPLEENLQFSVKVDWFACKDECVPGNSLLSLSLPLTEKNPVLNKAHNKIFS